MPGPKQLRADRKSSTTGTTRTVHSYPDVGRTHIFSPGIVTVPALVRPTIPDMSMHCHAPTEPPPTGPKCSMGLA